MKQRRLGKHGPMVSPIGIGAMSFSNFYGETSEADSHAILNTALDEGVTHIDTADIYGPLTSEEVIGSFIPFVLFMAGCFTIVWLVLIKQATELPS